MAARGSGMAYRFTKFVGRHRLGVAVSALLLLAALGGFWRIVYERDRARQAELVAHAEAENSRQVADYLISMFEAASPERVGAASVMPRDIVDRSRRELDVRLAHQPAQRARALAALGRIYLQLWQAGAAEESLLEAVRIERARGESAQLAEYLYVLGYVYGFSGRPAPAIPILEQAIAVQRRVQPGNHAALADELSTLGLAQARTGQPQAAIATIEEALAHARAIDGPAGKRVGESLYALARAQLNAGDPASAEVSAQRSLAMLREQLPPDAPSALSALTTLAAVTAARGRPAAAEELLREALDQQLNALDPGSFWAVTVRDNLARVVAAQGRKVEAAQLYEQNRMHLIRKHAQDTSAYRDVEAHLAGLNQAR